MKTYRVTLTETVTRTLDIEVEAENEEAAGEEAERRYACDPDLLYADWETEDRELELSNIVEIVPEPPEPPDTRTNEQKAADRARAVGKLTRMQPAEVKELEQTYLRRLRERTEEEKSA